MLYLRRTTAYLIAVWGTAVILYKEWRKDYKGANASEEYYSGLLDKVDPEGHWND